MNGRSPAQAVVSISLPRDLLARIDSRADSLNMTRSRYLAFLARTDVEKGGELVIQRREPSGVTHAVDSAQEIADFLEMAVPALADYERQKANPEAVPAAPDFPEALAENQFWTDFLEERDEILRLKWIESRKAGHDIGITKAIQLWLKHRPGWRAAHAAAPPLSG